MHVPSLPQLVVAEQSKEQKPGTFCVLLVNGAHSPLVQVVGELQTAPSAPGDGPPPDLLPELHAVSARAKTVPALCASTKNLFIRKRMSVTMGLSCRRGAVLARPMRHVLPPDRDTKNPPRVPGVARTMDGVRWKTQILALLGPRGLRLARV